MRAARATAALFGAGALIAALAGCSGGGASVGDTAEVTLSGGGERFPFDVTVVSVEPAPDEVAAQIEGDDPVYFAEVSATYTGDVEGGTFPSHIYHQVFAKLDDGSFLDATFVGLTECEGLPDDPSSATPRLESGEAVTWCVPLSGAEGRDVTGVYVGESDLSSGVTWSIG